MKFTKMHGCGNDYIYIDGAKEKISPEEKPDFVRRASDRHFGIGGDGVIFINPSDEADFEMEMYNADGSRAEMCGNGIRCVAKFVYDKGLTDKTDISVISAGKVKYLQLFLKDGKVDTVKVNMGAPELTPANIPVAAKDGLDKVVDEPIIVQGKEYKMTCVSMGNPHAVVFVEDVEHFPIEQIGPYFENHERFPNRTNTEFVKVLDRHTVQMRVWERGTGETLACGTGCCATAVACILNGLTDETVTVKLLGGELEIVWDRDENLVYMTGPAATAFEGEY
jgi:diaminopimelate epimerase